MSNNVITSNIGYPRFGKKRELKKVLEAYWSKKIDEETFTAKVRQLQLELLKTQQEKGVDLIPVGDFSLYDHVLDHAIMFGLIPDRFKDVIDDPLSLDTYFALARGKAGRPACEMTKWFDTNYHYIVPEFTGFTVTDPAGTTGADGTSRGKTGVQSRKVAGTRSGEVASVGVISTEEEASSQGTNVGDAIPEITTSAVTGSTVTEGLRLLENKPLKAYQFAKEQLGIDGKPVLLGPYTFLKLAKGYRPEQFPVLLARLTELYREVILQLQAAGARWIQLDEPAFVLSDVAQHVPLIHTCYEQLVAGVSGSKLLIQTYFDGLTAYRELVTLPVHGFGLDFVRNGRNLSQLKQYGFPQEKVLAAGVVNGRNIWKSDLVQTRALIDEVQNVSGAKQVWLQPSASLLHLPHTVSSEDQLPTVLQGGLSFAEERLDELCLLRTACNEGLQTVVSEFRQNSEALSALKQSAVRNDDAVKARLAAVGDDDFRRASAYGERVKKQRANTPLPLLPTTTIGSFPQTQDVRTQRRRWKKGELDDVAYRAYIRQQIADCIAFQERAGLDVLVHGEFERNDMVEFFGEKLVGFAFTKNGWVQSYGSRGVKPPIIYGDVSRPEPLTVEETVYAQSLTERPVKGMLTGPVTILNWSFAREDISRQDIAFQIALALRDEVLDLERHGLKIIQIDEPAFREGLPLKEEDQQQYTEWAVNAFRLASSAVKDETQIHTHMCYSEFAETIAAIDALQADVISIEASRSHGELIATFEQYDYPRQIGLGVYDIHSPQVPAQEEIVQTILRSIRVIASEQFWVNPDCGLKTRREEEVVPALENLVKATRRVRQKLGLEQNEIPIGGR
ncbi:5-methyltetrahydropteroyltriglutamate--homocysteine S-methyltransferase [Numidum massiliense]|uniref:5-methyltetrahydropteroyltriglutamate-- homocysteine S-methyltransferase n=1 Tax=Numidum massiliense TaxID=1522315 RepID=UPI0006D58D7A|nr:5-methyltetrahydropteroyltriglutamate--homocysteine S-methyltransferase [Numidum massiliense]